jgi:hypothetical protein
MRYLPTSLLKLGICLGAALAPAGIALGGDTASGRLAADAGNSWMLSATPYGWLPFLNGDVTIKGRTADIDVTPIEVLEHLDAAPWMSYVEARKGRLSFYNDIFYAKLDADADRARSFDRASLNVAADVNIELAIIEAGATYELARWYHGGGIKDSTPARVTALDLVLGARYWHQEMSLRLALTAAFDTTGLDISGSRAIARGGDVDWVDPLIGLRIRHQLAPGQELMFRADVGGFDVGSRISWNVTGAYNWDFAVRDGVTYSGMLGYRALSVDYTKGDGLSRYQYDVLMHGPVVGLSMKF